MTKRSINVKAGSSVCWLIVSVCLSVVIARAQQPTANTAGVTDEPRVGLTEATTAFDVAGREALGGHLRQTEAGGTQDAAGRKVLVVIENRHGFFHNFRSGYATVY